MDYQNKNSYLRLEGNVPFARRTTGIAAFSELKQMSKFALAFAAIASISAGAAFAEEAAAVVVADADGNGVYSMEEIVAAYPAVTEEIFKAADVDTDGSLSAEELAAAVEAGSFAAM